LGVGRWELGVSISPVKKVFLAGVLLSVSLAAAYGYGVTRREANYRELLLEGDAAAARGDLTAALEAFSGAIAVKSDSMAAYLKRGETYRKRNELEAALRDLRRAADLDPSAPRPRELLGDVSYALGRYPRAVERYEEYLALDDSSHRIFYKLGLAQYRSAQAAACIESERKAISIEEQFPEAHYVLGLCLRDAQKPKEALIALERSVTLAPAMLQGREELADVYGRLGRPDDRIAQLEALLALDASPSRDVAVGLAHAAVGDAASAVQVLGRAARRFPDYKHTYVALGRVWLQIAQTRDDRVALGKALDALQKAAQGDDNGEALTLLGRALLLSSQLETAEQILHEATLKLPVEPLAFFYLANAAEQLGHAETARAALLDYHALEAGESDPQRTSRLALRIADLSMRLGDYPAAISWYQRTAAASRMDSSLLVRLAEAQWRFGSVDAARASVGRALALDPAHAPARALQRRLR
jgi:tetratricopeptide (TPR) repeat protein